MSRPLRIEYPDTWYHVMNWGRQGDSIFRKEDDYLTFIELLKETVEMRNVVIYLLRTLRGDNLEEIVRNSISTDIV